MASSNKPNDSTGARTKQRKKVKMPKKSEAATPGQKLADQKPPNPHYMGSPLSVIPMEVSVASDCSGLCTEGLALRLALPLRIKIVHKYASESCTSKRS